jgi:hypothetical protein
MPKTKTRVGDRLSTSLPKRPWRLIWKQPFKKATLH